MATANQSIFTDLRRDNWDGTFRLPDPTHEQAASNKLFMDYAANVIRQGGRRREWALWQVFLECPTHCLEMVQMVRNEP